MAIRVEHDLHRRRWSRNLGVGLVLAAFVAIVFGMTVIKMRNQGAAQGFDHVLRPELLEKSD